MFNPNPDYDDVPGYVEYSASRSNKAQHIDTTQLLFEKANAVNAHTDSWEGYSAPQGYAKVKLVGHDFPENLR